MMEILLTGKPISAQRAYEIGLVNRLAEPAALIDSAIAFAAEILEGAPLSVRAARETVMLATEMGRSAALEAARHAAETCYRSEDARKARAPFPRSAGDLAGQVKLGASIRPTRSPATPRDPRFIEAVDRSAMTICRPDHVVKVSQKESPERAVRLL